MKTEVPPGLPNPTPMERLDADAEIIPPSNIISMANDMNVIFRRKMYHPHF